MRSRPNQGTQQSCRPVVQGDRSFYEEGVRIWLSRRRHDVVDAIPGTPDDPFGWNDLRTVEAGGSVSGDVMRSSGVKEQAFYKFHGWVMENGRRQDVDPDGYCGS